MARSSIYNIRSCVLHSGLWLPCVLWPHPSSTQPLDIINTMHVSLQNDMGMNTKIYTQPIEHAWSIQYTCVYIHIHIYTYQPVRRASHYSAWWLLFLSWTWWPPRRGRRPGEEEGWWCIRTIHTYSHPSPIPILPISIIHNSIRISQ